jgi:hypothetical protein
MVINRLTRNRAAKICEEAIVFACIVLLPYAALSLRPSGSKAVWFALWAFIGCVSSYWLAPLAGYLFVKALCRTPLGLVDDFGRGHQASRYSPTPFPERLWRSLLVGILGFITYYFFFK